MVTQPRKTYNVISYGSQDSQTRSTAAPQGRLPGTFAVSCLCNADRVLYLCLLRVCGALLDLIPRRSNLAWIATKHLQFSLFCL